MTDPHSIRDKGPSFNIKNWTTSGGKGGKGKSPMASPVFFVKKRMGSYDLSKATRNKVIK